MSTASRECDLCHEEASVYCAADEAHICWTCDAKVHGANFLVARHTRAVLCGSCGVPTSSRVSGLDFSPLAGFCPDCAQQESQGECSDGSVLETGSAPRPAEVGHPDCRCETGHPDCKCETECSSSNAEGDVLVEEVLPLRAALPCESTCSEDMGGAIVDNRSAQESVSSGILVSLKRKRLDCSSPVSAPQKKQIATRALEDVNRGVAHRQRDITTASVSRTQGGVHSNQGSILEARNWNTVQFQELGYNNRVLTGLLLSSAKHQRMDVRSQMGPSFARHQQSAVPSTAKLMRMLAKWHWDLHLSSPDTVPFAIRMFRKVSRALAPAVLSNTGMRATMAACLRLASGLDEAQITVPKACEVAACAGVSIRRLAMTEIHVLALLQLRRIPMLADTRT